MLNILSLGAGVQSTAIALMAARGDIEPMPDCAIFADTGAEPQHVYDQLDFIEENVPFPVHRVMAGNGLERAVVESIKTGEFCPVPFRNASLSGGGMLRRQCTREFKMQPIQEKVRELCGLEKGERGPREISVSQWLGISMDEMVRMKPHSTKWVLNRWPLIELQMYRYDCLRWMSEHGYEEPKKSACYFCPYSSDEQWSTMREEDEDSWDKAVKMDNLIRGGARGAGIELYIHRSMVPLEDCDFNTDRDQFDMFDNECEGLCGV